MAKNALNPATVQEHKKKKMTNQITYKKGQVCDDHDHVGRLVAKASIIELQKQTTYDNGSQSITVTIHFK